MKVDLQINLMSRSLFAFLGNILNISEYIYIICIYTYTDHIFLCHYPFESLQFCTGLGRQWHVSMMVWSGNRVSKVPRKHEAWWILDFFCRKNRTIVAWHNHNQYRKNVPPVRTNISHPKAIFEDEFPFPWDMWSFFGGYLHNYAKKSEAHVIFRKIGSLVNFASKYLPLLEV